MTEQTLLKALSGARVMLDRIDRDTVAAARVMRELGADVVLVGREGPTIESEALADARAAGLATAVNVETSTVASEADIVLVHDYTSPREAFVDLARRDGRLVTHWAELVLELADAVTVGVTGSAGKSTTARLIAKMLQLSGMKVATPTLHPLSESANPNWELWGPLQTQDADAFVLELTSSHLEYLLSSPDVAVVTTISADHIEWHGSLDAYLAAKGRIFDAQTPDGWAVINLDEPQWDRHVRQRVRSRLAGFGLAQHPGEGAYVADDHLVMQWDGLTHRLLPLAELASGIGHLTNGLAAAVGARAAGAAPAAIAHTLKTFPGLAGRFELVASGGGVCAINDGIALTPRKATAALAKTADKHVVLICGGDDVVDGWSVAPLHSSRDEGPMLDEYFAAAAAKAVHVFVVGSAARRMRAGLLRHGLSAGQITLTRTFADAVTQATEMAPPGHTVLLAPVFDVGEENIARFNRITSEILARRRADKTLPDVDAAR